MVTVAEFIKFVDCIRQNLMEGGYAVYSCSGHEVPNCLTVVRDGRKYKLNIGVLDEQPFIGVNSDEVDDGDIHAIHAAIDRCMPTFGNGAVA